MPCTDCEKLQGVAPGAICVHCVRTMAYLASQDEARLANAHEQLQRLYAALARIQWVDQEPLRRALKTGDQIRILNAVLVALNWCRDEAAIALNPAARRPAYRAAPHWWPGEYAHELPSQRVPQPRRTPPGQRVDATEKDPDYGF